MAGHVFAGHYAAGVGVGTHGAEASVVLGTVSDGADLVAVSLDGAGVAFAFGSAAHIDAVAVREHGAYGDLLTDFVVADVLRLELFNESVAFLQVELLEHAALGLVEFLELGLAVANAHRAVAVGLFGLLLHHCAGTCLHDGDRSAGTVSGEYLRHSDFSS